jgi:hypothetical protein
MTKIRLIIFPLLALFIYSLANPVQAQTGIQLASDTATPSFPNTITFKAEFKSGANITSVVLEYGEDQLTCGTVIAKAFPQLTAAGDVQVEWTWDMRQSGSVPPGATLWWHWLVQDANGAQLSSPTKTIIWLDSTHSWQEISGGNINLHYYDGGQSFGQALHDAAAQALVRLSNDVGISSDKPVDIYIFANTNDLQASILFAPSWAGGEAFPATNIVIIGVSTDLLDWGKGAEAHELTHVLVGHLTFSCLGFIPTWLNEGLAMYGEGGPAPAEVTQFDQAKAANQLLALSSLVGAFSDEANRVSLSYSEAYSVVNYLIQTYGRVKMTALLLSLRGGNTIDQALQTSYGFDTNGLEDVWRASIGAAPRAGVSNPTPVFTPTQVPTFVPIGAAPLAPAAPTPRPTLAQASVTPEPTVQPPGPAPTSVPFSQQLGISPGVLTGIEFGLIGCILAIVVIAVPVIVTTRRHSRRKK